MALEGLERVLQVGQGGKLQRLLPADMIPDLPSVGASASSPRGDVSSSRSSSDANANDGCGRCKECRKAAELSAVCFEQGASPPPVGVLNDYHKGLSSGGGGGGVSSRPGSQDAVLIAKQAALVWKEYFATCALCNNSYCKISGILTHCDINYIYTIV
jgi:hypothetical protein